MKGTKVHYLTDKSLTGTVIAVNKPEKEDLYALWYSRGRWHKRKRASAGKRLIMVQWDRPCSLKKWISEESVVVIQTASENKEQTNKSTNKGESAMTQVEETCPRCKGTGLYLPKEGAKCFKCNGQKVVMYNKMTDKQIGMIRSLFKQVREAMTVDEQQSLITKMNKHNNGTKICSTVWANKAIEKLMKYQPKPVRPVQVQEEDEPFGKVECHVCGAQYQPEEMGGSGTEVFTNGCISCLYLK